MIVVFDKHSNVVPSATDVNTSSAVIRKNGAVGAVASVHDVAPNAKESMIAHAVRPAYVCRTLSTQTSARQGRVGAKFYTFGYSAVSAIAKAMKPSVMAFCTIFGATKYLKAPDPFARHVNEFSSHSKQLMFRNGCVNGAF